MKKCRTLRNAVSVLLVVFAIQGIVCPPVDPGQKHKPNTEEEAKQEEDLGLEYGKYLQQVVQILEQDKDFAKKLENVSTDDIKSGKVATQLEFVNHNVRSKLDELKRIELDRLRMLARQEFEQNELGINRANIGADLHHVDYKNPHTFEVEDLRKLIQTASNDLDKLNEKRKEEFKQYEMEKEHQYRENLKHMTEEERKLAEAKHLESQNRHKEHPKIHHPGSKPQLEQVWEEQDNLPKEEFNPSTFFAMHDINGDGYWDEEEVEAILSLEIKKMYEANNSDDDPVEMVEEYHRMREHIYNETDANKDGLISKAEFMDMTKKAEFNQDEGWKGLDEERIYTDEELANYEEHLRQLAMAQNMQFPPGVAPPYYPDMGAAVDQHGQQFQQHQGQFQPPHGQFNQNHQQGQQLPNQQHPQQGFQPPQPGYQQYQPQHGNLQGGHQQQVPPQHNQFQQQVPPQHNQFQQQVPPQHNQFQQQVPPQHNQFQQQVPPQHNQFQQQVPPQHNQFQQQVPPQHNQVNQPPPPQQQGGQNQIQQLPPQQPNQVGQNQVSQQSSGVPQQVPSQPPVASNSGPPQVPVQNQPSSQQAASQKPTGQ